MPHRPRSRLKQVALAMPVAVPWIARCVDGILAYAGEHGGWNLLTSPPSLSGAMELSLTVSALKGWPGDGIIACINDRTEAANAQRLKVPVVVVGGVLATTTSLPVVRGDHDAIGRIAAEHLLERGFRRLAFYGIRGLRYARQRMQGFVDRAGEAGVTCEVLEQAPTTTTRASWQHRLKPLTTWLQTLTLPVGIMAVHDYRARILLEECLRLGLHVPHDVAIIGVDNDTTVCEHCQPTLTSVSHNAWKHGCEAATLLDRLMAGETPEPLQIVVPPDGVVERRSTDVIAVDDPDVSAVVHYMQDHLGEIEQITDTLNEAGISRRLLEKRFQQSLGTTPHEYLCRLRVEQAKHLLASDERPKIQQVARQCGFSSADRMRLIFLRVTGKPPSAFCGREGS